MSLIQSEDKYVYTSVYELLGDVNFTRLAKEFNVFPKHFLVTQEKGVLTVRSEVSIPEELVKEYLVKYHEASPDYLPKKVVNQTDGSTMVYQSLGRGKEVLCERFVTYHKSMLNTEKPISFFLGEFEEDETDDMEFWTKEDAKKLNKFYKDYRKDGKDA